MYVELYNKTFIIKIIVFKIIDKKSSKINLFNKTFIIEII